MTSNIQIVPTLFCNMSCKGCYLSSNKNKKFIKVEDYNLIANYIIKYNYDFLKINKNTKNTLEISLLGGEVSAVYSCEDIIKIKNILYKTLYPYFNEIYFGIQSNLILSKKKLECLIKNNINVGTSFNFDDTRSYKGSLYKYYKKFFQNYNFVLERFNKKLGIVIVLNKNNIKNIREILEYLLSNNFYFVLSPYEQLGSGQTIDLRVDNKMLTQLYINLYEYILKNEISTDIQPLKNYLLLISNNNIRNKICGFENYCHRKSLSFFFDEKVYVCPEFESTLLPNIEIGNWRNMEIYYDNIKKNIYQSYILPDKCKKCNVLKYCNGICPAKRLLNKNLPYYCKTYYNIFNYLLELKEENREKFNKLLSLFNIL